MKTGQKIEITRLLIRTGIAFWHHIFVDMLLAKIKRGGGKGKMGKGERGFKALFLPRLPRGAPRSEVELFLVDGF